jgi:hypothetical protein
VNKDPNTPRNDYEAGGSASGPPAHQTPAARDPGTCTGTRQAALTTSDGAADPDAGWAGKGFTVPGPREPAAGDGSAAWEDDAWVAGYAAGVESGLDEFIALLTTGTSSLLPPSCSGPNATTMPSGHTPPSKNCAPRASRGTSPGGGRPRRADVACPHRAATGRAGERSGRSPTDPASRTPWGAKSPNQPPQGHLTERPLNYAHPQQPGQRRPAARRQRHEARLQLRQMRLDRDLVRAVSVRRHAALTGGG